MLEVSAAPVVVVTGAGRGLGRAHALALAERGYAVVVNDLGVANDGSGSDRSPAQQVVAEIEAIGGRAVADASDVTDWQAAGGLIQKAIDSFGRLDALVNNAGCLRDKLIFNVSEEDWDAVIRVNLKGTAAPLHHAARYWRERSKEIGAPVNAAVVNTTSGSGLYSNMGQANYAAAKAGVASLTVVASRDLARYGVRVNAIAPVAATRLTDANMNDAMRATYDPGLVSPLVVHLLSDAASELTGRVFEVGSDGFLLVDQPRPIAGFRTPSGKWTPEALAEAIPAALESAKPQITPLDVNKMLHGLPLR